MFWPFTAWINCSSDLKNFENSRPSASNFRSFFDHKNNFGNKIPFLLYRRLAAQAVAKRVCRERNWHLGGLVGYKVGLDKGNTSKDTRLVYVTTGILIKMLISQKNMSQWTHIVIDEVHERDKDMDFLLLLTRKFIVSTFFFLPFFNWSALLGRTWNLN